MIIEVPKNTKFKKYIFQYFKKGESLKAKISGAIFHIYNTLNTNYDASLTCII